MLTSWEATTAITVFFCLPRQAHHTHCAMKTQPHTTLEEHNALAAGLADSPRTPNLQQSLCLMPS